MLSLLIRRVRSPALYSLLLTRLSDPKESLEVITTLCAVVMNDDDNQMLLKDAYGESKVLEGREGEEGKRSAFLLKLMEIE